MPTKMGLFGKKTLKYFAFFALKKCQNALLGKTWKWSFFSKVILLNTNLNRLLLGDEGVLFSGMTPWRIIVGKNVIKNMGGLLFFRISLGLN